MAEITGDYERMSSLLHNWINDQFEDELERRYLCRETCTKERIRIVAKQVVHAPDFLERMENYLEVFYGKKIKMTPKK